MSEPPSGSEGPIAEYVALRQEMNTRAQIQHGILVTQLTVAGAVFGFVLGDSGRTNLLLIVPISTYLLCGRHVAQADAIDRIRRYLREELHTRVPGGLHWDHWNQANPRRMVVTAWLMPMLLTFPAVSLCATVWGASGLLRQSTPSYQQLGWWTAMLLGGVATILSAVLLLERYHAGRAKRSG